MLFSQITTDRQQRWLNLLTIFLFSITLCSIVQNNVFCEARTSEKLKVKLSHGGILVGRYMTSSFGLSIKAFLGVPYARPPTGILRFNPPVPFGSWVGQRYATEYPCLCMQSNTLTRNAKIFGCEDCLYINIYTPVEIKLPSNLPVMVWFQSNGWQCGTGEFSSCGPDYFLNHNIVLVTANFRLGPLGFLSTETIDCPGNDGLKDQVEVLKWIKENIVSFGGNPESVTIFGQGFGGASVTYHMLSPKSKGLFHKGIAQSGTYFNPWAQPAYRGVAAKRAKKLGDLVGCPSYNDQWSNMLECLRDKPAKQIVATQLEMFEWDIDPMIPFPPVVEPKHPDAFLSILPRDEQRPHGVKLPLLIGATSDEGLLKTAAIINHYKLLTEFKYKFYYALPIIFNYGHLPKADQLKVTTKLNNFYFSEVHDYNRRKYQNLTDLITDGWFYAGIDEYIRLRVKHKEEANTFLYTFAHKGEASFSELFNGGREVFYGACHADDLQYLFPVGRELFKSSSPTSDEIKLRAIMIKSWVNFATNGYPTKLSSSLPMWFPITKYPTIFTQLGTKHQILYAKLFGFSRQIYQERLDLWQKIIPYIVSKPLRPKNEL